MDHDKLREIQSNLYRLPGMEERMRKLQSRIAEAKRELTSLLVKYEAESLDVERLQKESFSTTLLRLSGRYNGRLDKETREMIQSKLAYDKAVERVRELQKERDDLSRQITGLHEGQRSYEAELKKREQEIRQKPSDEESMRYHQLEAEQTELSKQSVEIEEAIRAAVRAKQTALRIIDHLKSADNWATYDVWSGSGILSHMAKYNRVDSAEEEYHRLSSNLKDLEKELKDIRMGPVPELSGIDSTTRAIDFWFDNIFTDLNVRSRIREDKEQATELAGILQRVITRLESNQAAVKRQIESKEQQKEELLLGRS